MLHFHVSVSKVHERNNLKEETLIWAHSEFSLVMVWTWFLQVLVQWYFSPHHSEQTVRKGLKTGYNTQRHTSGDLLLPLSSSQSFKQFATSCCQLWMQHSTCYDKGTLHTLYIIHVPIVGAFHILYIIHVLTVISVLFSTLLLNV